MKLDDLIKKLQELQTEHGNCNVELNDADTGWLMQFNENHVSWDEESQQVTIGNEGY